MSDKTGILISFLSKFTQNKFFTEMIKVILYPSDFSGLVGSTGTANSVIDYMKGFLKDLNKTISTKVVLANVNQIRNNINMVSSLLNIRESSTILLSYDNIYQHLPTSSNLLNTKLISDAINDKIESQDDFRRLTDTILNTISSFYEIESASLSLTKLDNFAEHSSSPDVSVFDSLKQYKDLIIDSYNNLSSFQSLNKAESLMDYFIISDESSAESLSKSITEYIFSGYSYFKSGYDLLDRNTGGFESSTLHLIAGASNTGKSLFLINLCKNLININIEDFEPNDAIIFITLEDDIYKVSRRFISTFGHYKYDTVKQLFIKSYEILRAEQKINKDNPDIKRLNVLKNNIQTVFNNLLKDSIVQVTKGKVNLIIKHAAENSFSPADLGRFIDRLKVEKINVKGIFFDYVDVANPSITKYIQTGDYDQQGQIVHELRTLARNYKVPLITNTQNKRDAENAKFMSNSLIGDSIKKVRYTDFLYMLNQQEKLDIFLDPVKKCVFTKDNYSDLATGLDPKILLKQDEICAKLIPIEIKITKSKDSGKDFAKYLLFCKDNLRIYNTVDEYLIDAPFIEANTKKLAREINSLTNMSISTISNEAMFSDQSNPIDFSNMIK